MDLIPSVWGALLRSRCKSSCSDAASDLAASISVRVVSDDARPGVRSNFGPVSLAYEPELKVTFRADKLMRLRRVSVSAPCHARTRFSLQIARIRQAHRVFCTPRAAPAPSSPQPALGRRERRFPLYTRTHAGPEIPTAAARGLTQNDCRTSCDTSYKRRKLASEEFWASLVSVVAGARRISLLHSQPVVC
jgi:hypothetical protein